MFTTYHTDKVLDLFRGTTYTAPGTIYVGLLSAVSDHEAGTVTECSFSGYARESVTLAAALAGLGGRYLANSVAVTFGAKADAGTVTVIAVGLFDALTVGNLMAIAYLDGKDPVVALVAAGDVTANTLQAPAHGWINDQRCRLEQQPGLGLIPTGLAENTDYWVVGSATDTVQLAASLGGSAIDITAKGGGLLIPITALTLNQNDQANFATSTLKFYLD